MPAKTCCHHCGRPVGRKSCRQTDSGWFCLQRYLIVGEGIEVIGPERTREPWEDDSELIAAAAIEQAAQHQYDAAHETWINAVHKLAEYKIGASEYRFTPDKGWIRQGSPGKRGTKLTEAEKAAKQARDDAGEALRTARVAYAAALRAAPRDYETRLRLLRYCLGAPCPKCWQPMLEPDHLILGRSVPLSLNPKSRRDRIEHAECPPQLTTAAAGAAC